MRRSRKSRARRFCMPEISLTPLIDTALTLLVIFMVTAPMIHHGIKVNLPQGQSKESGREQELVVTMSRDGKIYFNSYPVEREDLVEGIKKSLLYREDTPVYVRADESITYGEVIKIVDTLKQAGVRFVSMATKPTAA
jgi:biopolymer transport protein TolR